MTRIRSRLDRLEQRAAPIIKAHNTIRLYWVADHPRLELVTFDDCPAFGVLAGDVDRLHLDVEFDLSYLTDEQLEVVLKMSDGVFDDMSINVQNEMIAYIRAGEITFDVLAEEFNEAIATEAFKRAGVSHND